MAINRKSDAARNAKLDALTALFNGGTLEWRTGAAPATPAAADAGVLLATNACANPAFNAAVAGSATYNADTPGVQVAVGNIGHCRAKDAGGAVIADYDVGLAASGASMIVDKVAVATLEKVAVTSFTLTEPM